MIDYLFQPEIFSEKSEITRQYLNKLETLRILYIIVKIKNYLKSMNDGIIKTKEIKDLRSQLMQKIIESIYLKARLSINRPQMRQNLNFGQVPWDEILRFTLEKYSQLINTTNPIVTDYNMSFETTPALPDLNTETFDDMNFAGPSGIPAAVIPMETNLDISDVTMYSVAGNNIVNESPPPIIESENFVIKPDSKVVNYGDLDFRKLLDKRNFSYPFPLVRLRSNFENNTLFGYNQDIDLFMGIFTEYSIHDMASIFKLHYPLNMYSLNNDTIKRIAVNTSILKHFYKIYFSDNVDLAIGLSKFRYEYPTMIDEPLTREEKIFFNSYLYGNLNLFKIKLNVDFVTTSGLKDLEKDTFFTDMKKLLTEHAKEKKYLYTQHKYTYIKCYLPVILNEAIYFQWAYEGQAGATMKEIYELPLMAEYLSVLSAYINSVQLREMNRAIFLRDYFYWFINDNILPAHFENLTPENFNVDRWYEFKNYTPWIASTLYSDYEYTYTLP